MSKHYDHLSFIREELSIFCHPYIVNVKKSTLTLFWCQYVRVTNTAINCTKKVLNYK